MSSGLSRLVRRKEGAYRCSRELEQSFPYDNAHMQPVLAFELSGE